VNNVSKTAADLFEPDFLNDVERELNRTLPLREWGALGSFHFRRADTTMFYLGGGYIRKEGPVRSFSFKVASAGSAEPLRISCTNRCASRGDPDRDSLEGQFNTPEVNFWQIVLGWRMAGLLDLRVDAAGPFNRKNGEPLLRVVIGRSFPVGSEE
jgi:hypothetical protein